MGVITFIKFLMHSNKYLQAHNTMIRLLDQNNIHIVKVKSFHDDPDDAIQELKVIPVILLEQVNPL